MNSPMPDPLGSGHRPPGEGGVNSPVAPAERVGPMRLLLGVVGVAGILFGAWGVLTNQGTSPPLAIVPWWIGVVVLHDGIIAPVTIGLGWLITHLLPRPVRAPVQAAGVTAGLIALFAVPLLLRQGQGFPGGTLLTRNYAANVVGLLVLVIAVVAVGAVVRALLRRRVPVRTDPVDPR